MSTTITKTEYKKLLDGQMRIEQDVKQIKVFFEDISYDREVKPAVLKKWGRISKQMDKSTGKVIKSRQVLKNYILGL